MSLYENVDLLQNHLICFYFLGKCAFQRERDILLNNNEQKKKHNEDKFNGTKQSKQTCNRYSRTILINSFGNISQFKWNWAAKLDLCGSGCGSN